MIRGGSGEISKADHPIHATGGGQLSGGLVKVDLGFGSVREVVHNDDTSMRVLRLAHRVGELARPIQMCDALSRNTPKLSDGAEIPAVQWKK
jgi:hypothetical protein